MIPPDSGIDRDADTPGMAGFDLRLEQVDCQVRMPPLRIYFRVVINPTMVTAGKAGDRIHPCFFQRLGEFIRVEPGSNAINVLARVKIEVNLAKRQI
jgi:hypothetical protein